MSCLIDQKAEEVSFTRLRGVNRIRTGLPDLWVPNPTLYLRDELAHRPEAVYHRSGAVHDRLDEAGADEGIPPAS